jgi:hypothetical protein
MDQMKVRILIALFELQINNRQYTHCNLDVMRTSEERKSSLLWRSKEPHQSRLFKIEVFQSEIFCILERPTCKYRVLFSVYGQNRWVGVKMDIILPPVHDCSHFFSAFCKAGLTAPRRSLKA